jgi:protein-L-isoaspartate O-methyltransferase
MNIGHVTEELHGRFSSQGGSQFIASGHAIHGLLLWIEKTQPRNVLEIGAGIGTLTAAMLLALSARKSAGGSEYTLTSLEPEPYCLEQLEKNLAGLDRSRHRVVPDMSAVDRGAPFDFVIVDGGVLDERYFTHLAERAVVFVEGYRSKQRELLERVCAGRPHVTANFRSPDRLTGYWITQFDPSPLERSTFSIRSFNNRVHASIRRRYSQQ